jgi:hypothetical protein
LVERLSSGEEVQGLSLFKFKSTPLSLEKGVFLCLDFCLDPSAVGKAIAKIIKKAELWAT